MSNIIIFQRVGEPVSIVCPAYCGMPIDKIAQKDVPDGVPFWIVQAGDIPSDRTFRDAWELDAKAMGSPNGVGDTAAFTAWQAEEKGNN